MSYEIIIQALWIILPAYIANASAVLVGGGTPIDFGKKWKDGKRILGDGKTWRGLITGAVVGMVGGFGLSIVAIYANNSDFAFLGLNDFGQFPLMIPMVGAICFGALFGDITESFFKRRVGKDRGEDWIPFDQLDFIVGALVFSVIVAGIIKIFSSYWFFEGFTIWHIFVLVILTPFFHIFANFVHRRAHRSSSKESI